MCVQQTRIVSLFSRGIYKKLAKWLPSAERTRDRPEVRRSLYPFDLRGFFFFWFCVGIAIYRRIRKPF